ncbi:MAG: helix-turn-helix transcriptional regulator [Candidatus Moraniibacteriota bacterium]
MPTETLGEKLKELREKHFPGESLRKVSEKLEGLEQGKNFFAYLNKIESGAMLPSETLLKQLSNAYNLSEDEFIQLLGHHTAQKLNVKLQGSLLSDGQEISAASMVELFRKIKKDKK